MDSHKNFAYGTVATAPSPAISGTTLVLAADFPTPPTPPFNVTIWPASVQPTAANAEIARVTANSAGTLTIARAQEGTSARTVIVGDQVAATVTAKTLTDIESAAGGGGGAEPLYARLSIRGGAHDSGADVAVPLIGTFFVESTTNQIDGMAFTGPTTFGAGRQGQFFVWAPAAIPAGGVLVLNYAEFMLSNAAGTEKLRIEYDGSPITLDTALTRYYLPFADCSVTDTIGSDLTLVSFNPGSGIPSSGAAAIESAAGGQFFQELLVSMGYAPPA